MNDVAQCRPRDRKKEQELTPSARSLRARDVLAIHDAGRLEELASTKPESLTVAATQLRSAAVHHRALATVADTTADLLERALSLVSSVEAPPE